MTVYKSKKKKDVYMQRLSKVVVSESSRERESSTFL